MKTNRTGVFLLALGERSIVQHGPNNLTAFIAKYKLIAEITGEEAVDISAAGEEHVEYHYLEKKDGAINNYAVEALMRAYEWDGGDIFHLQDNIPDGFIIKAELKAEVNPQNGKSSIRFAWYDHRDSAGKGIPQANEIQKSDIRNKFNRKLRAFKGSSPVATPPPPTSKPTMSSSPPPSKGCSMDEAWQAFRKKGGPNDKDKIASEWNRILDVMFPGKDNETMTPLEWAKFRDEAPAMYQS